MTILVVVVVVVGSKIIAFNPSLTVALCVWKIKKVYVQKIITKLSNAN